MIIEKPNVEILEKFIPDAKINSDAWIMYKRHNRLVSLKDLQKQSTKQAEDIIDQSCHHYSTKKIYKIFSRLYEKFFGEPYPVPWHMQKVRNSFYKVRKFIESNNMEPESFISHNMYYLRNFCVWKGMNFRPAMLCTSKALARADVQRKIQTSLYGDSTHLEDSIYDELLTTELLLAGQYMDCDGSDDFHRLGIRGVNKLSEYYIASNPRLFEYVLDHDVLEYDKLQALEAISRRMERQGFKKHIEETHIRARVSAANSMAAELGDSTTERVLVKKNVNIMSLKFWSEVRMSMTYCRLQMSPSRKQVIIPQHLGTSLYGHRA